MMIPARASLKDCRTMSFHRSYGEKEAENRGAEALNNP